MAALSVALADLRSPAAPQHASLMARPSSRSSAYRFGCWFQKPSACATNCAARAVFPCSTTLPASFCRASANRRQIGVRSRLAHKTLQQRRGTLLILQRFHTDRPGSAQSGPSSWGCDRYSRNTRKALLSIIAFAVARLVLRPAPRLRSGTSASTGSERPSSRAASRRAASRSVEARRACQAAVPRPTARETNTAATAAVTQR